MICGFGAVGTFVMGGLSVVCPDASAAPKKERAGRKRKFLILIQPALLVLINFETID
jgi:hypothetical protein